jgi:hypothetical protein
LSLNPFFKVIVCGDNHYGLAYKTLEGANFASLRVRIDICLEGREKGDNIWKDFVWSRFVFKIKYSCSFNTSEMG